MESLSIPCPLPYQGSKRKLAPAILSYFPPSVETLYEPFAGSAAVTLAAAATHKARNFAIADVLKPLIEIWELILKNPNHLANSYEAIWTSQLANPAATYNNIRDEFNTDHEPAKLLYLVARCVKNAVRFNPRGQFNQSPDHRRLGMKPTKMRREIQASHRLLSGITVTQASDYRELLARATPSDLVYMDPPYQGVSSSKDTRYAKPLDLIGFEDALRRLNADDVPYLISFDGQCGTREYGRELAADLDLLRVLLVAGRSSQATLLGRDETTVESLYVSPALTKRIDISKRAGARQLVLLEGYA